MKSRKELRAEWLAALRSGEYKQAQGHLKEDGGYCCLGVLCEIAGIMDDDGCAVYGVYSDTFTSLPFEFAEYMGMARDGAAADRDGVKFLPSLICLNDDRQMSFEQIADAIEAGGYYDEE